MKFNGRKMVGVSRIRKALNFALPPQRRERDDAMIQRRTATEHEVPCIRVGVGQVQFSIGIKVQAVRSYPPYPWLGVVHRRGSAGEHEG